MLNNKKMFEKKHQSAVKHHRVIFTGRDRAW